MHSKICFALLMYTPFHQFKFLPIVPSTIHICHLLTYLLTFYHCFRFGCGVGRWGRNYSCICGIIHTIMSLHQVYLLNTLRDRIQYLKYFSFLNLFSKLDKCKHFHCVTVSFSGEEVTTNCFNLHLLGSNSMHFIFRI